MDCDPSILNNNFNYYVAIGKCCHFSCMYVCGVRVCMCGGTHLCRCACVEAQVSTLTYL